MYVNIDLRQQLTLPTSQGIVLGMSITAIVEEGVIRLPKDVHWKSGTIVRVEPVQEDAPLILDAFKEFDGMAGDLPSDLAANLDNYIHGHPRP
jgi:hypothetical protein